MSQIAMRKTSADDLDLAEINAESLITKHLDIWTSAIANRNSTGRGSNKKIDLYGIKNLRELILELAVRGKLVSQNPNEEPASELLNRVLQEKAQLVKEGEIKKSKASTQQYSEEKPFEVPKGWAWTRIDDFSEIAPRNVVDDGLEVGFVPMPLVGTSYKGEHGQEVRLWSEIKKGYTHFANGDIAIAKITPCFENSKAAVFSELTNGVGAGTTELHVARPISNEIDKTFVLLYLKSPHFLFVGESKMTGSAGQKRVPTDFFSTNPMPLPPAEEQRRIVEKVDELMALCDQLENRSEQILDAHDTLADTLLNALTQAQSAEELAENWQRLEQSWDLLFPSSIAGERAIDKLKQTILQLAVMGKLVPQDPNDEPASELLKRVAAEKNQMIKDKKIKRQNPLPPISDEEKSFEIPKGWTWSRFGWLGYDFGGGTPTKSNNKFWGGSIPWVSPKDMKVSKIYTAQDSVTELAIENSSVKLIPVGSLLMVVRGMILAHSFPVAITEVPVVINQDMKALVFSGVDKEFMLTMLKGVESDIVRMVERSSHGTCKLVSDTLWKYSIAIPPYLEQKRIVTKVDQLLTLCDNLKMRLQATGEIQTNLSDSLVKKAVE